MTAVGATISDLIWACLLLTVYLTLAGIFWLLVLYAVSFPFLVYDSVKERWTHDAGRD